MSEHNRMSYLEKIKKIFDIISEQIPERLKELRSFLFGTNSAKKYAQTEAIFYKELKYYF